MNKEEIKERILEIGEENLEEFVDTRLSELENMGEDNTVGDTFRDYISLNTHYKPGEKYNDSECPDLLFDDNLPYKNLVKNLNRNGVYNEYSALTLVFFEIYKYLPSEDVTGLVRSFTYASHKDSTLSIKLIRDNKCSSCYEKAGLAHNLFKFLGFDSELVYGYRDGQTYAFNIVYPNGYDDNSALIFDSTLHVEFEKDGVKYPYAYFEVIKQEDLQRLLNKEEIGFDLEKTELILRTTYGLDDSYKFIGEIKKYVIG
jgi:hypothetical protein